MVQTVEQPKTIWREPAPLTPVQRALASTPLLSALLASRGISDSIEATRFMNPEQQPLGDPMLLPDMELAIERIREAVKQQQKIGIFGDYDVDGLSSTAMLYRALTQHLGASVMPAIPHRQLDGYGLNDGAIDRFVAAGVKLLITVDCGSSDGPQIQRAIDKGLQVIVLDHHLIHGELPADVAFVSPRRPDNRYPETELAAVGVAFALIRALLDDHDVDMYLPYVALGTVADVVPLRRENRTLAARGLRLIRRWGLPGFKRLCHHAGIQRAAVDSYAIGFIIGPRLNAAGRMDTPDISLDWFLANTEADAEPHASKLDRLNRLRQAETRRILQEAEQQIEQLGGVGDRFSIVVFEPSWPVGVAGIVAGRLADRHHRPAIVIEQGGEVSRGSARSAGIVNMVEVLERCDEMLTHFGGHTAAAGLALKSEDLPIFRDCFEEVVAGALAGKLPQREIQLDARISHADISFKTCSLLDQLEPFGAGNPMPTFLFSDLALTNARPTRDGRHLQLELQGDDGRRHRAIFFGGAARLPELSGKPRVDIAGKLRRDTWGGRRRLEIRVEDIRIARP